MTGVRAETRTNTSRNVWLLALTSPAEFIVALDVLVVTTALGQIQEGLHTSPTHLEWTLTAYNVCLAGFVMSGAALGDRFGRRRMLMIGVACFTIGSTVCALAPGLGVLIGGRVIQGVAAALIAPLSLPLVSATFAPEQRWASSSVSPGWLPWPAR